MNYDRQINTSGISPVPFAPHAPRSRAAAFFDWMLGTHPQEEEPSWAQPSESEIVVAAPSERNSWWAIPHRADRSRYLRRSS